MAIRKKLIRNQRYYPVGWEGIDYEKWQEGEKSGKNGPTDYFNFDSPNCHFEAPPLREGEDPVYFEIGQLTPAAYTQQLAIQQDESPLNFDKEGKALQGISSKWINFLFRHGVKDLKGFEIETEDGIKELKYDFENGPYGPRLKENVFNELSFFLEHWGFIVAQYTRSLSARQS